ncbi:helix-turn-helix transcriptional regulator [Niallia sp. XMNu-256]|uniref:helix-turn-helix domain-containing protein n=1 Tax=Niallia sp. XMNu-256 TaxID=3082444 RepID=UPI0030D4B283
MIDYKTLGIGTVIENLRRRNGQTQEELADNANLERSTINYIERDQGIPNLSSILNIALALNMTPSEFFAEIEKQIKILDYYQD